MSLHLKRERFLPEELRDKSVPEAGDGFWGRLFRQLWQTYGDPHWWPGRSAWEVAVGAVLTQNTAWTNVQRALANLRQLDWTTPEQLLHAPRAALAEAIRPSGYFNQKAKKLRPLALWWRDRVESGEVKLLPDHELRGELLDLWGIGPETADAIALYAFGRPLFVVDAYTQRLLQRMRGLEKRPGYEAIQEEVHEERPGSPLLYNHLHGLIVVLAKEHCRARSPLCASCPVLASCTTGQGQEATP